MLESMEIRAHQGNQTKLDYQGPCPIPKMMVKAISSCGYREDSAPAIPLVCHCARPRKSPTIGQLLELTPPVCRFDESSCIQ